MISEESYNLRDDLTIVWACMSGRGRDNSGNETRAGAGGQWHGNCDDYYECGHEKYDDRVTPVKCHHSGAQPSQASPASYFMTGA